MTTLPETTDIAIVGSGFSGLAMAVRLRQAGITDFVILERADDLGGTWRDNSYPGCACDVPSHLYSFSFAPNPEWTSTFSPRAEIWDYLRKVARDFGILPHIHFHAEMTEATWNEAAARWGLRRPLAGSSAPRADRRGRPAQRTIAALAARTRSSGVPYSTRPPGTTTTTSPGSGWR